MAKRDPRHPALDEERLKEHIKLCKRNLKRADVVCCATCPFEQEIVSFYPELQEAFDNKRRMLRERG